jgi:hypothetical protein
MTPLGFGMALAQSYLISIATRREISIAPVFRPGVYMEIK